MKIQRLLTATALFLTSVSIASTHWSAVRFDGHNTFQKIVTVNSTTVFAVGTGAVNSGNFLLRTNDAGIIWDSIPLGVPADTFELTDLFFVDMNTGFVGGRKNSLQILLKTIDNGNNWSDITPDPASASYVTSVSFTDAQNGLASDWTTMYSTTNGGATWTSQAFLNDIRDVSFINLTNAFASGTNAAGNAVVMKSSNGGLNWNTMLEVHDPFLFVSSFSKLDFINADTGFTFLANTNKIYCTKDGGISWDTLVMDSVMFISDIDFSTANTGHLLSVEGQIFVTLDRGQTWNLEYATSWGSYGPLVNLYSISFNEQTGFASGSNGLIKKHTSHAFTGITESKPGTHILVYPNPFSAFVTIHFSQEKENGNCSLQVNDMSGRIVYLQPLQAKQIMLTLPLSSGMYFYSVLSGNKIISSGKFIGF